MARGKPIRLKFLGKAAAAATDLHLCVMLQSAS